MLIARRKQSGFTIVELLIVIVVIGILAAITIVAYSGIKQRAADAQTISIVDNYYKAFIAYALDHGSYPNQTGSYCLGDGSVCVGIATSDSTAMGLIRPYMNNANPLPLPNQTPVTYYNTRTGAAYSYMATATLDGVTYPWGFNYILQGDVSCGLSNIAGTAGGWPNFTKAANPTGATERAFGNVYCRLILPDPATL